MAQLQTLNEMVAAYVAGGGSVQSCPTRTARAPVGAPVVVEAPQPVPSIGKVRHMEALAAQARAKVAEELARQREAAGVPLRKVARARPVQVARPAAPPVLGNKADAAAHPEWEQFTCTLRYRLNSGAERSQARIWAAPDLAAAEQLHLDYVVAANGRFIAEMLAA